MIPLGVGGGYERRLCALLLFAKLELDIGRLLASGPVQQLPALDRDSHQRAKCVGGGHGECVHGMSCG